MGSRYHRVDALPRRIRDPTVRLQEDAPLDAHSDDWLEPLKRIAALAATGEHYATRADTPVERFHADRYREMSELVGTLISRLADASPERVRALLPAATGHATPLLDVRAAVVEADRILLVRERSDGRWTLPGGFAETGSTAASNVEREVLEEAGLKVRARRLYALVHKASHPYDADLRDFYKLFFLCERRPDSASTPTPCGVETLDARFFDRGELPELSTGRVIAEHVEMAFEHAARVAAPADFDAGLP